MLFLAIPQGARAAREQARQVVENLLLPAIDLVRVNAARSASRAILALNAASNFLRDLVISILRRLRQSRTLHTLTFGPISGVHFKVKVFKASYLACLFTPFCTAPGSLAVPVLFGPAAGSAPEVLASPRGEGLLLAPVVPWLDAPSEGWACCAKAAGEASAKMQASPHAPAIDALRPSGGNPALLFQQKPHCSRHPLH